MHRRLAQACARSVGPTEDRSFDLLSTLAVIDTSGSEFCSVLKAQPLGHFDDTTVRLTLRLPLPHAVDRLMSAAQ
jgi:hypothetical protein